ncbi:MAG: methylenetetrahydrofolate--tRNA-(uracil(54)-C(5))-methyltransferase (FADH(2)-oxidizing) TrmFO [Actinomycetia bacterium]|nr:methylenetetrahydrofolate--tRNA-(uracil(54)-C(5))-methyltransferase (FADH(2)-oxidizing) TrmFO [Actinomycetes bacterium]
MSRRIRIIGAGLAGSEAAWQLAERGHQVDLYEMRPHQQTAVHVSDGLAELVCSNSLKSLVANSAAGCLKYELAALGSFVLEKALATQVAAGKALAVDRQLFSAAVTAELSGHPRVNVIRREFTDFDSLLASPEPAIIAAGPLCSAALAAALARRLGVEQLAFYDAAAPIVEAASLDRDRLFSQSRYVRGSSDYLNAPLDREQYEHLVSELTSGRRTIQRDFEAAELFQACQPVEELARRGVDVLRYGALKPVGLIDPTTGRRPWAVVQLRAENRQRSAYNLVGFQTNLAFDEQKRIFRLIPGLEAAEFSRYGVMHRNSFINAPQLLTPGLAWRAVPHVYFAGQICGTEGYLEAVASGLVAALAVHAQSCGLKEPLLPPQSAFGSLLAYATDPLTQNYQPMHVNYGIMVPLESVPSRKAQRYEHYARRAAAAIDGFRAERADLGFLPRLDDGFLVRAED